MARQVLVPFIKADSSRFPFKATITSNRRRYVARNALTGKRVRRAETWRWSSLWIRESNTADVTLAEWPLARPSDWKELVNQPQTAKEIEAVQHAINRGCPFGSETWTIRTAERLGLESTLRPRGRPRKHG